MRRDERGPVPDLRPKPGCMDAFPLAILLTVLALLTKGSIMQKHRGPRPGPGNKKGCFAPAALVLGIVVALLAALAATL